MDRNWIEHIDRMDKLRSGIYLRSYAQNNPLQQYVQEGFDMFEDMNQRIDREIAMFLLKVRLRPAKEPSKADAVKAAQAAQAAKVQEKHEEADKAANAAAEAPAKEAASEKA